MESRERSMKSSIIGSKQNKYKRKQTPDSLQDAYSPQRLPDQLKNDKNYVKNLNKGIVYTTSENVDHEKSQSNRTINIEIKKINQRPQSSIQNNRNQNQYSQSIGTQSRKNNQSKIDQSIKTVNFQQSQRSESPQDSKESKKSKMETIALKQLTASILEVIAQGEKSCEIIRKVMFETPGFNSFDLFSELREYGPAKQKELQKKKQLAKLKSEMQEGQSSEVIQQQIENLNQDLKVTSSSKNQNKDDNNDNGGGESFDGVDDKSLNCFLEVGLQQGTLRSEITIKDCQFFVNIISQKNLKAIPYEQLIDFVIPQSNKKVTTKLLNKIKKKDVHDINKCPYEVMCLFAKLTECEILIKKKIQRLIQRFHAKIVGMDQGRGDLQISQLFQTMDGKNEGKINKGQIKGLMVAHGTRNMVPEDDVKALCRRLDHDQDGEVSFSDFFGAMLPYFIFGNLRSINASNPLAIESSKPMSLKKKLQELQIKTKAPGISKDKLEKRQKSNNLGKTKFQRGFFQEHQDLLVFEEGKKYDFSEKDPMGFVSIRNKQPPAPGQHGSEYLSQQKDKEGKENKNLQIQKTCQPLSKKLFSQNQPELLFYRKPALSSVKGFIRKNNDLQKPHATYIEPLMKFFHDSIDFERVQEINKQELILQEDFSIYQLFKILSGKQQSLNLALVDLQTNLSRYFNVKFLYKEIKLALIRQFPISAAGRVESMRYQDFQELMKPKSKEFQSYVQRKQLQNQYSDAIIKMSEQNEIGLSFQTVQIISKYFEELLQLENQLEEHRKKYLSQINIRDCFKCMDRYKRGYTTLEDYYVFIEEFYCEDLPISTEEIDYLFKRHDKEKLGRVTEATFLKELMPLDDYIVIE